MTTPAPLPKPFLPLESPHATLETVGGKGANLARLTRAGFNVPNGFLLPTESYRQFVAEHKLDTVIHDALKELDVNDPSGLESASQLIRSQFEQASVPISLRDALFIAYGWLGAPPVAVRSSATAEDLPEMSFAGQQDTFLNIISANALTEAVVKCWSSLWTARAIGYRARHNIQQEDVSLSVVVQKMVQADVSGVMFTANPLSGKRDEIVIDATFGLGEALVSGQVEPDNYVVSNGSILSKALGAKATVIRGEEKGGISTERLKADNDYSRRQALPDDEILTLAKIGQRIYEEYDFPQDIEWAFIDGELHILQSRPITSLYPIPEGMKPEPLKVMLGFHSVQGILEPMTPLGIQTIENVLAGGALAFGVNLDYQTQTAFYEAGERIWINLSPILRHPLAHKAYPAAVKAIDPAAGQIFEGLIKDPRLTVVHQRPKLGTIINLLKFIIPFWGRIIFKYWRDPENGAGYFFQIMDEELTRTKAFNQTTGDLWEDFRAHLALWERSRFIFSETVVPKGVPGIVASMVPFFGILQRFGKAIGEPQIHLEISRGLPNNVTTEMDLILWKTAQDILADEASLQAFAGTPALQLATDYQNKSLPNIAQQAVDSFMSRYGMRGLGEIDMGRPRWREEPFHIIQTLQSYLEITDPELAPDAVFKKGAEEAELAAKHLEMQVRKLKGGKLKSRVIRWSIRRYRNLAGLREAPKFFAIQMMSIIREGLLASGRKLVAEGLLEREDDLFFVLVPELIEIGEQETVSPETRGKINERRELREREMRRKQLPRVLLSDGTAYFEGMRSVDNEFGIFGDPVSPGVVEGSVRVVLNPHETKLLPGEILVCLGTDPAWTPLFLAAGGLVMEVGGMMTHGSVVAREYGIPAVVGVHEATTRLKTGMRIRVDGSSGAIEVLEE